jgi:glycosyltransferase involved in cell wall biosynthesis
VRSGHRLCTLVPIIREDRLSLQVKEELLMAAAVRIPRLPTIAFDHETRLGGHLLVFGDDWGRHPSSVQHLVSHLLDRHPVAWINTIGTRKPRLDRQTWRRGVQKIVQWTAPAVEADSRPSNLEVHNPWMWPWFSGAFDRALNRTLLTRQLKPLIAALPEVPVAVTTVPIVGDLMDQLRVARWVYYCVDDFTEWPGLDGAALRVLEEILVTRADCLIAAGERLNDRLAGMGRRAHVLTHGVEPDFWQAAEGSSFPALDGLERPLVVYWGLIDQRMDSAWLARLADELPRGTIVLAGPENDAPRALRAMPRVRRLGRLEQAQLPRLAQEAAVLIMPYADLPVTRAMQPLKLKEYLAAGRPVVARDLPAMRPWADCLDLASSPEQFAQAVRRRLQEGLPPAQHAARARLVRETWAAKAEEFENLVFGCEPDRQLTCLT